MGGWMPYVRFRGRNGLTWRPAPGEGPYPHPDISARVSLNAHMVLGDLNRMEQSYMGTHAGDGDQPINELAERAGVAPEVARAVLSALFYDTTNGYVMPACARCGYVHGPTSCMAAARAARTPAAAAVPDRSPVTGGDRGGATMTHAIRAHLEFATAGKDPSIPGYVERLRRTHQATAHDGRYTGCTCGSPLCAEAVLIVHIDNLTAAYEQEHAKFVAETARPAAAVPDPSPVTGGDRDGRRETDQCATCGRLWMEHTWTAGEPWFNGKPICPAAAAVPDRAETNGHEPKVPAEPLTLDNLDRRILNVVDPRQPGPDVRMQCVGLVRAAQRAAVPDRAAPADLSEDGQHERDADGSGARGSGVRTVGGAGDRDVPGHPEPAAVHHPGGHRVVHEALGSSVLPGRDSAGPVGPERREGTGALDRAAPDLAPAAPTEGAGEAWQAIYDVLVDHPYHCQQPCCEFSHEREAAFGDLVDDVARAVAPTRAERDALRDTVRTYRAMLVAAGCRAEMLDSIERAALVPPSPGDTE